jgi:DinB superfamily
MISLTKMAFISPSPDETALTGCSGTSFQRGMLLLLTGAGAPVFSEEEVAVFKRGSEALRSGDQGADLARLKLALEETHKKLIPTLQSLSDEALAAPVPEKFKRPPLTGTVGEALASLHYHEGYHNGQIGLLRRLAGREGAIK